jgi:DNA-binding PucR family transcriptional regulator
VREAYREASAAATAAGPGNTLTLAQMPLVDRLTVMLASGAVPERLIPERVRTFIGEDLAKHGQLIATISEYAACDLNARRAASALFVHRNTVLYRLQRVSEQTGLDPHLLPQLLDLITAVRLVQGLTAPPSQGRAQARTRAAAMTGVAAASGGRRARPPISVTPSPAPREGA